VDIVEVLSKTPLTKILSVVPDLEKARCVQVLSGTAILPCMSAPLKKVALRTPPTKRAPAAQGIEDILPLASISVQKVLTLGLAVGYAQPSTVKSPVPNENAVAWLRLKESVLPPKYPLPPYSAVVYDAVGENGWNAWTRGVPTKDKV
jgi:hypothetical protein